MDIDSVLNQMRHEHAPTPEDRERVRAALATVLVVSGTAGAAHVATTAGLKSAATVKGVAAIKGAAMTLPVWIKGAIGVGTLVAAVGGGVYGVNAYQVSHGSPLPTAVKHTSASAAAPVVERAPMVVTDMAPVGPGEATVPAVAVALSGSELTVEPRLGVNTKPRGGGAKASAAQATATTSLAELRLIGEASRAIREGRTEEARTALSEHERRYSNTALGQERVGLDLLARCAEGANEETRRAAEALLRSSPKSPLAGSIRRECLK
jgi:hypothetical protein